MKHLRAIAILLLALLPGMTTGLRTAQAQQLVIGAATIPSIDPHFAYLASNVAYAKHVFSTLTHLADGKLQGDLALSWQAVEPTIWEFKLRPDVRFHDGSPLTADDVAFSLNRVITIPNSPVPYASLLPSFKSAEVVDPLTLRIHTTAPEPLLPRNLNNIGVVSRKAAEGASTADFSKGTAAIGSGPFRFAAYVPGERYELLRNDAYYGPKPAWEKVTFRVITQDSSRIAALLAGDVDLIDAVPPAEAPKLRENKAVTVHTTWSDRIFVLYINFANDGDKFLTDRQGRKLTSNPLRDVRVRRALALGIDRKALVSRVMDGAAREINQMTYPQAAGFNHDLPELAYDPAAARRLLAEAGYPEGFGLTVHCSSDRYPNDGRICQTVGQMLARIGLDMKVEALPKAIFFAHLFPPTADYAFGLLGVGDPSGEGSGILEALLRTRSASARTGMLNAALYSNPDIDREVVALKPEFDAAKRAAITQRVMAMAAADLPYVPLFAGSVVAASKKTILFNVRTDEMTLAQDARPAP